MTGNRWVNGSIPTRSNGWKKFGCMSRSTPRSSGSIWSSWQNTGSSSSVRAITERPRCEPAPSSTLPSSR